MSDMEHIHPIMQRTLAGIFPSMISSEDIVNDELNSFEYEPEPGFDEPDVIGICLECLSETINGVCQNMVCKGRLL